MAARGRPGTGRPPDFAVLTAVLTTPSLPLGDPWPAGERLPSSHLGTWVLGLPLRAAGVPSEFAHELVAALLAGLAAASTLGALRLRGGGRRLASLGALALVLAGTFDGARQLLRFESLAAVDLLASSRRVPNAVTEWPLFTLRLGGLRPHALGLPFLVLWAGVAGRLPGVGGLALQGAVLGTLLAANPWDLPAALLVLAAGTLCVSLRPALGTLVRSLGGPVGFAVPVLLPFVLGPRPTVPGLAPSPLGTASLEAFLHLGGFVLLPALALCAGLVRSRQRDDEALLAATAPVSAGIALSIATGRPVLGLAAGFLGGTLYLLPRLSGALRNGFLLAAAGSVLAAVPELLVVVDPRGKELRGMNTLSATWAGAVPLLVLGSVLVAPLALASRRARLLVLVLAGSAGLASLAHPLAAVASRLAASGRPAVLGWSDHEGIRRGDAALRGLAAPRKDLEAIFASPGAPAVSRALRDRNVRFAGVGPLERKERGPDALRVRQGLRRVLDAGGASPWEAP